MSLNSAFDFPPPFPATTNKEPLSSQTRVEARAKWFLPILLLLLTSLVHAPSITSCYLLRTNLQTTNAMCYSKVTIYACKCKEREKANCHQPGPACKEKLTHEIVNVSREFCFRHSDRMDLDPAPGRNPSTAYTPRKPLNGGYSTRTEDDGIFSPDIGQGYDLDSPVSPISLRDLPAFPAPTPARQAPVRASPNRPTKTTTVAPPPPPPQPLSHTNGPSFAERSRAAQSPGNKPTNAKGAITDNSPDALRRRKDGQRVSKMTYRIGNAVNDLASINQPGLDLRASRSSLGLRGTTIGPVDLPTIPDHVFEFDHPMPNSPTMARHGARKARQAAIEANGKIKAGDKASRLPTRTGAQHTPNQRTPTAATAQTPTFPGQRPNLPLTDPMTAFKPEYYVSSFAQPTANTHTAATTLNRPTGIPAPINTAATVARPSTSHYNTRSRANPTKTSPTYAGIRKQQRPATSPRSPRAAAVTTATVNARARPQHQPNGRQPNHQHAGNGNGIEPKQGQYRLFPGPERGQTPHVTKAVYPGPPPPPPPPMTHKTGGGGGGTPSPSSRWALHNTFGPSRKPEGGRGAEYGKQGVRQQQQQQQQQQRYPPPPPSNTRPVRPPPGPPPAPMYATKNTRIPPPKKQQTRGGRGGGGGGGRKGGTCQIM